MSSNYRRFAFFFISMSILLFSFYFIRFFSKIILVNQMHCNSATLQYIADYTLADWVNVITETNWSTENNSEEYEHYSHIYSEMMSYPNQSLGDEKTDDGKARQFKNFLDQIENKVNTVEDDIEKYANEKYFGAKFIKKIRQRYQKFMIGGMVYARNDGEQFDLCNGYTWKAVNPDEKSIVKDRILKIGNSFKEKNINYLVVQIPSRISYLREEVPLGANEYSNQNLDQEFEELTKQGLKCYDLRMDMYHEGWNPQDGYFATDPHWTPESGLLAAKIIASYLNENCNFSFDLSLLDESSYEKKVFDLNNLENKEQITIPFPQFPTEMVFRNFEGGYEYFGTFEDAVFDQGMLNLEFKKNILDIYSGCRIRNTRLGMIETESPTNDKIILFDVSSMSWYTVSYLALQTKQSFFSAGATPEQLEYLIEVINPDIVISIK